ncbi:MAG: hypothetical protein V4564_05340 [Pseudomonadota bacterium]|uniref:hypothetical protein n=1 Tax=Sphingomonas sp. ERG5 TaxID=1381597 RepID=UPI00054C28F0|nr:hypothetical protein [Sphingomonas sp. ERG5]
MLDAIRPWLNLLTGAFCLALLAPFKLGRWWQAPFGRRENPWAFWFMLSWGGVLIAEGAYQLWPLIRVWSSQLYT